MSNRSVILSGFVIAKFLLQYALILPDYDLHRDEYLHLDQANHLAWGYLSVPPVTSWVALLIQGLGNSVATIRFFPAFFGALTLLIVWKTVERLNGSLYACVLAATCLLFSVLLRLNQLFQPNSLDVLCWTTLYYTAIQYITTQRSRWLYWLAVVFAVGFLNKYNIVFLLIGLLPAVLLTPQRRLLANRHVFFSSLVSLLLIAPNLIWQYQHAFPVLHHMKLLADTQLINVNRADFLREQFLYFIGSWLVIGGGLYGLLVYEPFRPYRSFCFALLFTLLTFLYLRAKGYYAIGIYPIYIAFGAVFIAAKLRNGWARAALVALPPIAFVPLYQVAFPNKAPAAIARQPERYRKLGLLRWEDGRDHQIPQDFADMLGWRELAAKVDRAYVRLADPVGTLVLCDNYGQAGAINYYTKQKIRAVTFNADYINWFKLDRPYRHLIRVKEVQDRAEEMGKTGRFFLSGYIADSVTNPFARERGTTIFVFRQANTDINARLVSEIKAARW